jgi:hypothetical protein
LKNIKKNLQILENPNDPRIPENFELIYRSDKTGIMIYKIESKMTFNLKN